MPKALPFGPKDWSQLQQRALNAKMARKLAGGSQLEMRRVEGRRQALRKFYVSLAAGMIFLIGAFSLDMGRADKSVVRRISRQVPGIFKGKMAFASLERIRHLDVGKDGLPVGTRRVGFISSPQGSNGLGE